MGNKHDGKYLPEGTFIPFRPDIPTVDANGNSDAKVLAKAFEEFSKGGLTPKERETIEKFDDLLKTADIVINKEGTSAVVVQEDGNTFKLNAPKGGRGK